MPKICYAPKKFTPAHQHVIDQSNEICEQYAGSGLSLTLRQLYYQHVARGYLPNQQNQYKRLSEILTDARMAGVLDWDYLVDRTRNLVSAAHWSSPRKLVEAAAKQYRTDLWRGQGVRVEVWIEKDAGIGVIEAVCDRNDVPYFSCRGYTSVSELWSASQRIGENLRNDERTVVLHVGDHDPSGLDMTRDIDKRLRTFLVKDWLADHPGVLGSAPGGARKVSDVVRDMRDRMGLGEGTKPWVVHRIALNRDQILRYQPPPNPAKTTDSRFEGYAAETGLDESWELDALDPFVLQNLIQGHIDAVRDRGKWGQANLGMEASRATLHAVAENWTEIYDRYRPEGLPAAADEDDQGDQDDEEDGEDR